LVLDKNKIEFKLKILFSIDLYLKNPLKMKNFNYNHTVKSLAFGELLALEKPKMNR
jgi:hypothetical protein